MWVKAPPVDGKANHAVAKLLSQALKIPISHCQVYQGHSSRYKILRLPYTDSTYQSLLSFWPAQRPKQDVLF